MQLWACPVEACDLQVLTPNATPVDHACPHYGIEIRISWMAHGPSLLSQLWSEMDELTALLLVGQTTPEESLKAQGRARGVAFSLSLFMAPHLRTEDEVVAEAVKRYQMKQAGEPYETPGLGARIYEPPPGENKYSEGPSRTRGAVKPQDAWRTKLDPDVVATIKKSTFPVDMLAQVYSLTQAQIRTLQEED
jgi:hypothetical protein